MVLLKLCDVSELPEGECKRVWKGEFDVAIFNLDGKFYVTDDTCTHGPSSLSDGFIDGDSIECPFHNGAFHIPTGKATKYPCTIPLRTYPAVVIDNELFIEIG